MLTPTVSVVIPAYNHEDFIAAAMQSVADQTFDSIELVVVDDGSPDATLSVARKTASSLAIPVTVLTKPNGGVSSTLNAGIAVARGEFIAVLASDDRFLPEKIERQIALIRESGAQCGMVHCGALDDTGSGSLTPAGGYVPAEGECFRALVAREVTAIASSVLFRRTAFDAAGGFDETLVGEDLDFYAAVAAKGYLFEFDPTPMLVKRVVPGSLGSRVDLLYMDPFITLRKHADRLTPVELGEIETNFYRGMGLAAAGVGRLGLSLRLYATAARRTRHPGPLAEWAVRSARHIALTLLGTRLRRRLREGRNVRAAGRFRPASNTAES